MAGTSRAECQRCRHVGALHAPDGCRLNGCGCRGFVGPEGRRADPLERVVAELRGEGARLRESVARLWVVTLTFAGLVVVLEVVR